MFGIGPVSSVGVLPPIPRKPEFCQLVLFFREKQFHSFLLSFLLAFVTEEFNPRQELKRAVGQPEVVPPTSRLAETYIFSSGLGLLGA